VGRRKHTPVGGQQIKEGVSRVKAVLAV